MSILIPLVLGLGVILIILLLVFLSIPVESFGKEILRIFSVTRFCYNSFHIVNLLVGIFACLLIASVIILLGNLVILVMRW